MTFLYVNKYLSICLLSRYARLREDNMHFNWLRQYQNTYVFFRNAVNICYLCSLFAYLYFAETVLKSQDTNETDIKKALANVLKYAPDRVGGGGRRK